MSAHYHYVKLPARVIPPPAHPWDANYNLVQTPEHYQCTLLGNIHLGFVGHSENLYVWQCQISKSIFFAESFDYSSDHLFLVPEEHEYNPYRENKAQAPTLEVVYKTKVEQFCQFVMGWKPSVWDYDKAERENLVAAIKAAAINMPED